MSAKPIRLTLARADVSALIYALEEIIDSYDEAAANEPRILAYLEKRLKNHDRARAAS